MQNPISFLGDISLNDKYIELYKNGAKPFEGVKDILFNSQLVVGNLECMAKGNKGENLLKKPRLKTNLATLNYLKDLNLGLALLAHNHVYDNLEDGFVKTINFLKENNIDYIGAGLSQEEAERPFINKICGENICILNYVTEDTNPNLPNDSTVFLNLFDEEKVIFDIKKYKEQTEKIILCLHWGGRCEGGFYPDWEQPGIAKRLINAGADLIIGNHSHTFQPFEVYRGKYIFYSLGNFCFSDYWFNNELIPMSKRRMISSIIQITFSLDEYYIRIDYYLNNITKLINFSSYRNIVNIRNLIYRIFLRNKIGWNIYYFHKQFILPLVLFFERKDISIKVKLFRLFRYVHRKIIQKIKT